MEFVGCGLNEVPILEDGGSNARVGGGRRPPKMINGQEPIFKSKNLIPERKRRQKLSDRLLALRSLVPIITNMNKGTIIEDAITYIDKLKNEVEVLTKQLLDMEAELSQEPASKEETRDGAEEMKKWGIQTDVSVTNIDGNKLWIKIIFEKKRGSFTRLMESLCSLGFELTDTSLTTSKGAILISSCLEGVFSESFGVEKTKELLLEIIKSI